LAIKSPEENLRESHNSLKFSSKKSYKEEDTMFGNNNCDWIILILLFCCGGCGGFGGNGNGCGCGCGGNGCGNNCC
jgi:hypothetical protein